MKISTILVVCVGNICRSPVGERLLAKLLPDAHVHSMGLGALVDEPADKTAVQIAEENGLSLDGHVARQFDPQEAGDADLILVMEPDHRRKLRESLPHLSGRVWLYDQWTGARGIADPYRRSEEFHRAVYKQIASAAEAWAGRVSRNAR